GAGGVEHVLAARLPVQGGVGLGGQHGLVVLVACARAAEHHPVRQARQVPADGLRRLGGDEQCGGAAVLDDEARLGGGEVPVDGGGVEAAAERAPVALEHAPVV